MTVSTVVFSFKLRTLYLTHAVHAFVFLFLFFLENAGLPEREARCRLLSEHGETHAVM